eukprot:scaffold32864_cov28-Tisochrysis_lutea.AAC.5
MRAALVEPARPITCDLAQPLLDQPFQGRRERQNFLQRPRRKGHLARPPPEELDRCPGPRAGAPRVVPSHEHQDVHRERVARRVRA